MHGTEDPAGGVQHENAREYRAGGPRGKSWDEDSALEKPTEVQLHAPRPRTLTPRHFSLADCSMLQHPSPSFAQTRVVKRESLGVGWSRTCALRSKRRYPR